MSKIFNVYSHDVDRTWYSSSNVIYSECIDNTNALKTLKVTFKSGKEYQYDDVNVMDYLEFRNSESQGKGLNKYIISRKYEAKCIGQRELAVLADELEFRKNGGYYYDTKNGFSLTDAMDKELYSQTEPAADGSITLSKNLFKAIGKELRNIDER